MNQELRIVASLKAFDWLRPYQRKEVARCILSVARTADHADRPAAEVAAMFSTALAVLNEPDRDNEKAA